MNKIRGTTTEVLMVWLAAYVFFLASLANNLSASHDSINYLRHIAGGKHLFHQHHLLYHFFAHYWLNAFSSILPTVSEHYIVQAFTALWGSSILAVCYLFFVNRFHLTKALALAGTCVIAFSYGTWFYSVNVEVYSPANFFILCALYKMGAQQVIRKDLLVVALLHAGAMLFHQINVLFTVVCVLWIWRRFRPGMFGPLVTYFAVAGLITGLTYFFVGWFIEMKNDPVAFADWILGYTVGHSYWQMPGWQTPLKAAAGLARSFIGGQFLFQLQPVTAILESGFSGHALEDEKFLTRNLPASYAWMILALSALFGLAVLTIALKFVAAISKMATQEKIILPLFATLIVYSAFFCFWMPEILDFWILQMVLIWLLLIGMLPLTRFPFRIHNFHGTLILAIMLFVINYFGSIRWLRSFTNDWYYQEIHKIEAREADLIIIRDKWMLKDYARYFTTAHVIAADEPHYSPQKEASWMRQVLSAGGRVFVHDLSETAVASGAGPASGAGEWKVIQSY